MFVKVNKPKMGQNVASCGAMAEYLDKEKETDFFSSKSDNISKQEAIDMIDANAKGGLKRNEDKFYMISINPSQNELNHLIGRQANSSSELTDAEKLRLQTALKDYTHDVMTIYAQNFGRDNINSNEDLVYFARVEKERQYREYDKDVIDGSKKVGDNKEGLNYHVHIVVSRKAKDGKTLLSPNAKSRGNSWNKDGTERTRGFNHEEFKQKSIEKFNKKFNYKSNNNERYSKTHNNSQGLANSLKGKITGKLQGQIKGKVISELMQGQLTKEVKAVQTVAQLTNPQKAVKDKIIQKLKEFTIKLDKKL